MAWLLLSQEYAHRTRHFAFVSQFGRRSLTDKWGNRWSIEPLPTINGISVDSDAFVIAAQVAGQLGYDPHQPPDEEFMCLRCMPDAGSYEIACDTVDRAHNNFVIVQRKLAQLRAAYAEAEHRRRKDMLPGLQAEIGAHEEEARGHRKSFVEAKEIIENAVHRYFMIPMDAFDKMCQYGLELKCAQVTVLLQKKHKALPDYAGAA